MRVSSRGTFVHPGNALGSKSEEERPGREAPRRARARRWGRVNGAAKDAWRERPRASLVLPRARTRRRVGDERARRRRRGGGVESVGEYRKNKQTSPGLKIPIFVRLTGLRVHSWANRPSSASTPAPGCYGTSRRRSARPDARRRNISFQQPRRRRPRSARAHTLARPRLDHLEGARDGDIDDVRRRAAPRPRPRDGRARGPASIARGLVRASATDATHRARGRPRLRVRGPRRTRARLLPRARVRDVVERRLRAPARSRAAPRPTDQRGPPRTSRAEATPSPAPRPSSRPRPRGPVPPASPRRARAARASPPSRASVRSTRSRSWRISSRCSPRRRRTTSRRSATARR